MGARANTPYHVYNSQELIGKFRYSDDALQFAKMWAMLRKKSVDVVLTGTSTGSGIIGQFKKTGDPTPEFDHLRSILATSPAATD